jgi:hypothetical protein
VRRAILGGALVAATTALAGAALVGGSPAVRHPEPAAAPAGPVLVVGGQVAADDTSCDRIHRQIRDRQDVNAGEAEQCDQEEFAQLENDRQAARAQGEKPRMQISETCRLVGDRAERGDADLDAGLAFACRQRERFANEVNARTGLGPEHKVTALCVGTRIREERGDDVDAATRTACAAEFAARD